MPMAGRRESRMVDTLLDEQRYLLFVFGAELVAQRKANAVAGALRNSNERETMPMREDGQTKA